MDIPFGGILRQPFYFLDTAGKPGAPVDGLPTVTASVPEVTILEVLAGKVTDEKGNEVDGFIARVSAGGYIGSFDLAGVADVDRGAGVKELNFPLATHNALGSPEASSAVAGAASLE